jgi:ankyrin repeat protein
VFDDTTYRDTVHLKDGFTPLHVAAFEGCTQAVCQLLSLGARASALDSW